MPHHVDVHVGAQLRALRILRGFTQVRLAEATGITFQQVQKYETGKNRISASRLYDFAKVLDSEVSSFFAGIDDGSSADEMFGRLDIEFARSFSEIPNPKIKQAIVRLIKDAVE